MSAEPPKRKRPPAATTVSRDNGRRLLNLEDRVAAVEASLGKVAADTSEILAVLTATKSVAGFARKYGVRIITFGAGIFTAAGIGNPKVWAFISQFFG